MTHEDAEIALAALDKALTDRPKAVYNDLVAAVRCLVALRDRLIAEYRGGDLDAGERLQRMNAVFSLVVAANIRLTACAGSVSRPPGANWHTCSADAHLPAIRSSVHRLSVMIDRPKFGEITT